MMERNSHDPNDRQSRFSGEERARITLENSQAREARKKEKESFTLLPDDGASEEKKEKAGKKQKPEKTEKKGRNKSPSEKKSKKERQTKKQKDKASDDEELIRIIDEASKPEKKKKASHKSGASHGRASSDDRRGSRNDRVKSSTEKRKKNKKIRNALTMTALFTVSLCAIGLLCVVLLTINTIEVVNAGRYTEEKVIVTAEIKEGGSMLLFNSEKLAGKIENTLPYVEKAEIERHWPDKVVITLTEATATLAIDTGSAYVLMNDSCKVLDNQADFLVSTAAPVKGVSIDKCIPGEVIGFSGDIKAEDVASLVKALKSSGIETLTSADFSDPSCVRLVIDHRVELELGRLSDADERLLKFAAEVIERVEAENKTREIIIDLTDDTQARYRPKNSNEVVFEEENTTAGEQFG